MTETEIVQKVCEILEIKYHHFDNHKMSTDYFQHFKLLSIPKIVLYSSRYSHWEFAILEDMTVHTIGNAALKVLLNFGSRYIEHLEGESRVYFDRLLAEDKRIKAAEAFLKENDCAKVINDPNKKVHI